MTRLMQVSCVFILAIALVGCSKKTSDEDTGTDSTGDPDAGDEDACNPPDPSDSAWTEQGSVEAGHVIDGRFGDGEWDHAFRLEGVFTDMYLDYQAPYLYALNDWRANNEGIRPDCYNEFGLAYASRARIRVFGDGHIEVVAGEIEGQGAYSFSESPYWDFPHTIYEFRVLITDPGSVCVAPHDPVTESNCEELTSEPIKFSINAGTVPTRVARVPGPGVAEIAEGAACGFGEGICAEGLTCLYDGEGATCQPRAPEPDADTSTDVIDVLDDTGLDAPTDVPADTTPDWDFPEEPLPDE